MSEDDVLFGYRLRVLDYAGRTSVSEACRVFGIHRSTYYVWKRRVERHGLGILRPRERRRPRLPNQLSPFVEERIVAFALGHPGYGPRRVASELSRERWGGIVVSHNGVWRCLRRRGLNTRARRLSLVAGYAAPYEPPREPQPQRHVEATRPGELVAMDCFFVGRLTGTKGAVWQLTAIDVCSSYAWARARALPAGQPNRRPDLEARPPPLRTSSRERGGDSSVPRPITAASSAPASFAQHSTSSASGTRSFAPAGRKRMGTSKRYTG